MALSWLRSAVRSADARFGQWWHGIPDHMALLSHPPADLMKGHFGKSSVLRATKNCGGKGVGEERKMSQFLDDTA